MLLIIDDDAVSGAALSRALSRYQLDTVHTCSLAEAASVLDPATAGDVEMIVVSVTLHDHERASLVLHLQEPLSSARGDSPVGPSRIAHARARSVLVLSGPGDPEAVACALRLSEAETPRPEAPEPDHNLASGLARFSAQYKLSPRESQLLRLAIDGLNNDEAADVLGCRRPTVSSYWARIFGKTGVHCQRDVIASFLRYGSNKRRELLAAPLLRSGASADARRIPRARNGNRKTR